MAQLNILIWHIHGSYLNTLARLPHNWYVPTRPGKPEGYGGRGETFNLPDNLREVPAGEVRNLELDLVIYQTPRNLFHDHYEILSATQQHETPKIYLEHNTPKPNPVNSRHPLLDFPGGTALLVHVTRFNRLMWDAGDVPTRVIEHSVAISGHDAYTGEIPRGITVVNGMQKRPRISGLDVLEHIRGRVPIDLAGMDTEELGGFGDIPYRSIHTLMAKYRFVLSPIRYTSLPLAVVEAMTIGMPVVALATTELPAVITNGETGFVSCDVEFLIEKMKELIADKEMAHEIGARAGEIAKRRFGLDRFCREWDGAITGAIDTRAGVSSREGGYAVA